VRFRLAQRCAKGCVDRLLKNGSNSAPKLLGGHLRQISRRAARRGHPQKKFSSSNSRMALEAAAAALRHVHHLGAVLALTPSINRSKLR
jgi:hypothetical protein